MGPGRPAVSSLCYVAVLVWPDHLGADLNAWGTDICPHPTDINPIHSFVLCTLIPPQNPSGRLWSILVNVTADGHLFFTL